MKFSNKWIILIIIICLFFIVMPSILSQYKNSENFDLYRQKSNYDDYLIVSAKYKKSTDFLNEFPAPIKSVVIEKNKDVPNKAGEATSYLYYIIKNYDDLPENVIFIHDENESWHHNGKITSEIYYWINEYEQFGKTYHEVNLGILDIKKCPQHRSYHEYHAPNSVYKKFWDEVMLPYIGNYEDAKPEVGRCCAQFIVSKKNIQQHPKEFYEKYYNWLIENTKGEGIGDGEFGDPYNGWWTGRYAEYTWRFIFTTQESKPQALQID